VAVLVQCSVFFLFPLNRHVIMPGFGVGLRMKFESMKELETENACDLFIVRCSF